MVPVGGMLGGGSSINFMMYTRVSFTLSLSSLLFSPSPSSSTSPFPSPVLFFLSIAEIFETLTPFISFSSFFQGSASDYDDWNCEGWTANDLIPLARKMENSSSLTTGQNPKLHGKEGPLEVSYGGHQGNLGKEFIKVAQEVREIDYKDDIQDFNSGNSVTTWAKWVSSFV